MVCSGHDEYLYQVVTRNGCTLPSEALAIIRFHSFYPMHQGGAYRHLMNDKDLANLKWVKAFQKFDLYSKAHTKYDPKALKPVYQKMIEKYAPHRIASPRRLSLTPLRGGRTDMTCW